MPAPSTEEKRLEWIRKLSKASIDAWANDEVRRRYIEGFNRFEVRKRRIEASTEAWKRTEVRRNMSIAAGRGVTTLKAKEKSSESHKKYKYPGLKDSRRREWRERCIEYAGVYCIKCKVDVLDNRADFHHIYSQDSDCFNILAECGCDNRNWDEYKKEIDKCVLLCCSCHSKLHLYPYKYLVKLGRSKEYVEWFVKKDIKVLEFVESEVVKHHIDLNIKNNCKENLLFLNQSNHMKLHRNSYNYLLVIGEIQNYLDWFLKE